MKKIASILFLFATAPLWGQRVHRTERPPASTIPHGIARQSTALSAASHATAPPMAAMPAFVVTDRDGHVVQATSLARRSHWLLVYTRQNCIPCDKLLATLAASDHPASRRGLPYVIVVDASSVDALERVRAAYPNLGDATWVADTSHQAQTALKLKGAPVLYALRGSAIAFHVPGTLGDAGTVKNLATSWLTKSDAAGRGGSPTSATTENSSPTPSNP